MLSMSCLEGTVQGAGDQARALGVLAGFRRELYRCFGKRPDALFELADAVLCADGPIMASEIPLAEPTLGRTDVDGFCNLPAILTTLYNADMTPQIHETVNGLYFLLLHLNTLTSRRPYGKHR